MNYPLYHPTRFPNYGFSFVSFDSLSWPGLESLSRNVGLFWHLFGADAGNESTDGKSMLQH